MITGTGEIAVGEDALAVHFDPKAFRPESFIDHAGLGPDFGPWMPGICFLPECGAAFQPAREWQIYCSDRCRKAAESEFRRWGHRMALALLVERLGRYQKQGDPRAFLLHGEARKYIGRCQTLWKNEREAREAAACAARLVRA